MEPQSEPSGAGPWMLSAINSMGLRGVFFRHRSTVEWGAADSRLRQYFFSLHVMRLQFICNSFLVGTIGFSLK
jgi:hypothetical protein